MNPVQFCIWLRGCFDMMEGQELNQHQIDLIKNKLNSVFDHESVISTSLTINKEDFDFPQYDKDTKLMC